MKNCLSRGEVQEYKWKDTKQMLADILQRVEDRKPPKDVLKEKRKKEEREGEKKEENSVGEDCQSQFPLVSLIPKGLNPDDLVYHMDLVHM